VVAHQVHATRGAKDPFAHAVSVSAPYRAVMQKAMSEHNFEDDLEERDDVVDRDPRRDDGDEPREGEPWAKASSGDADEITDS
jgi:hypothetical protein